MKITKHGLEIDLSIYSSWPQNLYGCWIAVEEISGMHVTTARLIKNNDFPEHSIQKINYIPDEIDQISIFRYGLVKNEIVVVEFEVKQEFRNMGIGKFFGLYMWTWLMENNSYLVRMPYTFRSDEVEHMIASLSYDNHIDYAILKKDDGEYAPLKEIESPEQIWGLNIAPDTDNI